jgi:hypothetical protein
VGCKAGESLLKISRSEASIPTGAIKNNWKRNFKRAIIIMIATINYNYVYYCAKYHLASSHMQIVTKKINVF